MAKKLLIIVSVLLNVLFLLLIILSLSGSTFSFALVNHGANYLNSALIVSIPLDESSLAFGPVEITLRVGSTSYLQFAALQDGKQFNMSMEPLYDHNVVYINQGGFGIAITGINPGETVLQLFSPSGFKDIAYVTVNN